MGSVNKVLYCTIILIFLQCALKDYLATIAPSPAPAYVERVMPQTARAHACLVTMVTFVTDLVPVGTMGLSAEGHVIVGMVPSAIMKPGSVDALLVGLGKHVSCLVALCLSVREFLERIAHKGQ